MTEFISPTSFKGPYLGWLKFNRNVFKEYQLKAGAVPQTYLTLNGALRK
jgi:hypothetical protein